MRSLFLFAIMLVATQARADRVVSPTVYVSSAQADAQQMAATGIMRHSGRSGGLREGIGMGATPAGMRFWPSTRSTAGQEGFSSTASLARRPGTCLITCDETSCRTN